MTENDFELDFDFDAFDLEQRVSALEDRQLTLLWSVASLTAVLALMILMFGGAL